jgi:hypothetical protein
LKQHCCLELVISSFRFRFRVVTVPTFLVLVSVRQHWLLEINAVVQTRHYALSLLKVAYRYLLEVCFAPTTCEFTSKYANRYCALAGRVHTILSPSVVDTDSLNLYPDPNPAFQGSPDTDPVQQYCCRHRAPAVGASTLTKQLASQILI